MKTTIKFPNDLTETQFNSTIVSTFFTLILFSVVLIVSYNIIDFEGDKLLSSLIVGGVLAATIAAIRLAFSLKQTILSSTFSPLSCNIVEFKDSEYSRVQRLIKESRWSEVKSISNIGSGIAMRVEFVYSKDRSFAAYQYFKYVPHSYEPDGDIVYLDKDEATIMGKS